MRLLFRLVVASSLATTLLLFLAHKASASVEALTSTELSVVEDAKPSPAVPSLNIHAASVDEAPPIKAEVLSEVEVGSANANTLVGDELAMGEVSEAKPEVKVLAGGVNGVGDQPQVTIEVESPEPTPIAVEATPTPTPTPTPIFELPKAEVEAPKPPKINAPAKVAPAIKQSAKYQDLAKPTSSTQVGNIFSGASNSLVARTVGHAEGTRGADGTKNRAYWGHRDPGNGVWNMGTFSYQHGARTPEDADEAWLPVLASADRKLARMFDAEFTLEERLNGIDLYNQSPAAASTGETAYPIMLNKAKAKGLVGQAAILDARVWSYWCGGKWCAPGLGNTEAGIRHDQNRRMEAIAKALAWYMKENGREQIADRIIKQDLSKPSTPSTPKTSALETLIGSELSLNSH